MAFESEADREARLKAERELAETRQHEVKVAEASRAGIKNGAAMLSLAALIITLLVRYPNNVQDMWWVYLILGLAFFVALVT